MDNELLIHLLGPNQLMSFQLRFVCPLHLVSVYEKNVSKIRWDFQKSVLTHVLSIIQILDGLSNFGNCLG